MVKWIGKGQVNRPIWQYLQTRVDDFKVSKSFNRGGVFVASGTKKVVIINNKAFNIEVCPNGESIK